MAPEGSASAPKVVLSVAGSDPSGGAGIQADLKTLALLGVYGAAAVTSVTVQDTTGVRRFTALDPELVAEQVRLVLADLPVACVKIGMVGNSGVARAIAGELGRFHGEVIVDPVLQAGSGQPLLMGGDGVPLAPLLDQATVLTPNLPELAVLAGANTTPGDPAVWAAGILRCHPKLKAVVVTGGHGDQAAGEVIDRLFMKGPGGSIQTLEHRHPRIKGAGFHGTGCTFASAFAAGCALTGSLETAFTRACDFVAKLIAKSAPFPLGHGTPPLLHHRWHR